ncbi:alpha/beta hydrolase [Sphingopyxis macrogoltabida]|uniref:alpha/beta hydrolase n=1 Tax=Sphingopyxis macrogoltabida TaxID=33050 RepID=UPI0006CA8463|nr:alpha/beta hydrolase fold domain-containing protein [Sphingopyxis macrogoltabida]
MSDAGQFGPWVSDEAKARFAAFLEESVTPPNLAAARPFFRDYNQRLLDKAQAGYAVDVAERTIAGVTGYEVVPAGGAADAPVLLCLHGGAFMWGEGPGALLEAVPIAAVAGMRVLAVDYRLAPEHVYPAAVEDVVAVYRALIETVDPARIGIYGCSAGALLTTQAVARFLHDGLPGPGAIGLFHGAPLPFSGDAALAQKLFDPRAGSGAAPKVEELPYFLGADLSDPLVLSAGHPQLLALFPPSLLISATRDFAASAVSVMHRRLLAAGTDTSFVLFDGLWHAHHMDVDLPESVETYAIVADFFRKRLG